jgi:class 3 adenylate cyclase/tetratricopeptide (TPR) repeat protein
MGARDERSEDTRVMSRSRKTVSVLFCDAVGSTEIAERLDPETLQHVMQRYFDEMRTVIERHGGTVEKYIGDAVMAVFGVPVLHEDDALRAVRAALEMQAAMGDLNAGLERRFGVSLAIRVGVNTGEVVSAGDADRHGLVAGDQVNLAARLQAVAAPGAVVIGSQTRRLVRDEVRLRSLGRVAVRGAARPVHIWQAEAMIARRPAARRVERTPLVGRARELRTLRARFRRCTEAGQGATVTVAGAAGIGKSRLVRELLAGVGDRAHVVIGRCLPYGDGITYRALAEIVDQLAGGDGRDGLERLLAGDPRARQVATSVSAIVGGGDPGSPNDAGWAVRRLLEACARNHPLVVVFDDVHWAEDPLLDLIEQLSSSIERAPVMVICTCRPELLDRRPSWASAHARRSVVTLGPLSAVESERMLRRLAARPPGAQRRDEILGAAEGNPLFLEQYVAMRADDPTRGAPPTIQALLAARIDSLPEPERRVIGAAAVEGRSFHVGAVRTLLGHPEPAAIDAALDELVRRELLRPAAAEVPSDRGFRFTHILVRDASYDLLPKAARAEMHEAFAGWLVGVDRRPRELDEIVGYHLERAFRYREQLGRIERASERGLAERAADHLATAGRRALIAGDRHGAATLLRRAAGLRAGDDLGRAAVLIDLGGALREAGKFTEAESTLADALRMAVDGDDRVLGARAQVERLLARLQVDPEGVARLAARQGKRLEASLEAGADHGGLARLWDLRALLSWIRCRAGDAEVCWRRAGAEAQLAGDERIASDALGWEASAMDFGPTPTDKGIERCGEIIRLLQHDRWAAALAAHPLAGLHAMRGRPAEALRLLDESNAELAEFGPTVDAAVSHAEASVGLLGGPLDRAERHLRTGIRELERMGERAVLATTEGYLAQVLLLGGRELAAARCAGRCAALATADDISAQVIWRTVRGRILARRGDRVGLRLASEAVDLAATTDWVSAHADALLDQSAVHAWLGQDRDAELAARAAGELYRQKGHTVGMRRAAAPLAIRTPA